MTKSHRIKLRRSRGIRNKLEELNLTFIQSAETTSPLEPWHPLSTNASQDDRFRGVKDSPEEQHCGLRLRDDVKPRNPELEELDLTSYQDPLVAHCLDPHFQLRVTRIRRFRRKHGAKRMMIEDACLSQRQSTMFSGLNLVRSHLMITRRRFYSARLFTGEQKSSRIIFSREDYEWNSSSKPDDWVRGSRIRRTKAMLRLGRATGTMITSNLRETW